MTCDRERLSHYLDGELDEEETRQVRQHLAICERCEADLAAYRQLDDSISRLEQRRAPHKLRHSFYRRVEQSRRARARWGLAAPLLSPAVPLTAAFLVVGGVVAVWRLLPPGSAPVMTAAFAIQESPESDDGWRLELVFDRPIAADSLAEAVTIDPPLPVSQRVHENKVELVPREQVPSGSSYRVTVNHVRDQRGNEQSEPVVLNLVVGPTASLVQESRPAEMSGVPKTAVRAVAEGAPTAQAIEPTTVTLPPASLGGPTVVAAPTLARPTATTTSRSAPISSQTATLAPGGQPVAAAQPTRAATATSQAGQAASVVSVSPPSTSLTASTAGALLDSHPELKLRLGAVSGTERTVAVTEQTFQGGAMLARADNNQVYALIRPTSRWLSFANTWRPGEVLPSAGVRPAGTFEPLRGFGKIWRDQPAVKLQLGWPVYDERKAIGSAQAFENGTLLRSSLGVAYGLLNDGTWRTLPDPKR